jgi:hypothetical protein
MRDMVRGPTSLRLYSLIIALEGTYSSPGQVNEVLAANSWLVFTEKQSRSKGPDPPLTADPRNLYPRLDIAEKEGKGLWQSSDPGRLKQTYKVYEMTTSLFLPQSSLSIAE